MTTDSKLKEILEEVVSQVCIDVDAATELYRVRFMGRIKREQNIKHGWYVPVQNFDNLVAAKKSQSDDYFRFYFRIVLNDGSSVPRLQISKWVPSEGSVENYQTDFNEPYPDGLPEFKSQLRAAIEQSEINPK